MMKVLLVVSLIVSILVATFLVFTGYELVCDVDALIDRAQVSADRDDMLGYLVQLKNNLELHGMTHGSFALIFKTPSNDLALHFKTVNRVIERLQSIKDIPKNETAYQVALNDIRGTIRELPNPAVDYLWVKYWYLYFLGIGIWLLPLILFFTDDEYAIYR